MQLFGDELAVDGIGDRAPDADIRGRPFLRVESHPGVRPDAGIALVGDDELVALLQPGDGGDFRHERIHVAVALLHGDDPARGIADDPVDDPVHIGPALEEIVRVPLKQDVLRPLVFLQDVGAGADNILDVARMRLRILAVAVDVLRNDRHDRGRHRQRQRRMRMLQLDDDGVSVRRFDAGDRAQRGLERMVGLLGLDREFHVRRGDRLAVVKFRVRAQLEGHRLAVRRGRPAFRQVRMDFPVGVGPDQGGEDVRARRHRRNTGLDRRVEVARHLAGDQHQRTALLGRVGGNYRRGARRHGCGKSRETEFPEHEVPPFGAGRHSEPPGRIYTAPFPGRRTVSPDRQV